MKFTVERKTWYRGRGMEDSMLLSDQGQRCCIGFVGQQIGISDDHLHVPGVMSCREDSKNKWRSIGMWEGKTPKWVYRAYEINDSEEIGDPERERQLKELFAANGHEIEFVD